MQKDEKRKKRPSLIFMISRIYAWLNQPSCNNIETLSGSAGQRSVKRIIVTDLNRLFHMYS